MTPTATRLPGDVCGTDDPEPAGAQNVPQRVPSDFVELLVCTYRLKPSTTNFTWQLTSRQTVSRLIASSVASWINTAPPTSPHIKCPPPIERETWNFRSPSGAWTTVLAGWCGVLVGPGFMVDGHPPASPSPWPS